MEIKNRIFRWLGLKVRPFVYYKDKEWVFDYTRSYSNSELSSDETNKTMNLLNKRF